METFCKQHSVESRQQLKNNGLKITSARLGILDIFKHAKKPLSVKEIGEQLENSQPDLVTLYRNIEVLKNLDLIKQIKLSGPQTLYELSSQEHHHHLVCKICGKIKDVSGCKISVDDKNFGKKYGFAKITNHSLEFFGICEACSNK